MKKRKCAKVQSLLYNGDIVKQQYTPLSLQTLSAFFLATILGASIGLNSIPLSFSEVKQLASVGVWGFQKEEIATTTPKILTIKDVVVPIAVYHSVRPHPDGQSAEQERFDVTPELLKKHLEYLQQEGFTTISFETLGKYFDGETVLPPKPVILSFDDSWRNQYAYAFPLLKEYKMTGTFYVFTNSLDHGNHLSWNETREMQKVGMEIGSHTKFHPYLDEITDPIELKKEITDSKTILEESLGVPVTTFAYPFGEHGPTSIQEVKRAGYKTARSLQKGVVQSKEERYTLRAFIVTDNLNDFERQVESKI